MQIKASKDIAIAALGGLFIVTGFMAVSVLMWPERHAETQVGVFEPHIVYEPQGPERPSPLTIIRGESEDTVLLGELDIKSELESLRASIDATDRRLDAAFAELERKRTYRAWADSHGSKPMEVR